MERRKPSTTKPKVNMNPKEPMTKLQKQVTAWMKKHVPTKRTKFLYSHVVDYFSGKKAIDMLMEESPWAASSADSNETQNQDFAFESREQCVEFLDLLLRYKMFHRAKKVPVTEESGRKGKKKDKSDSEDNEVAKQEQVDVVAGNDENKENINELESDEKKQKKRKIRLDMHLDQVFVDSTDAFVWLYDPIPWYYWIAGGLIVIAVIILCLFPLWPRKIRRGAHWMMWLAACFMVGVLCLALFKYILYWALYLLSGFKLKFYMLPNLTEDTTFLHSFWPLYKYKYTGEVRKDEEEVCRGFDIKTSSPSEEQELALNQEDDKTKKTENVSEEKQSDSDSNESGKSFEFVEKCKNV